MTHCILTEPSLSPHGRKGREGNREGKGLEIFHSRIRNDLPRRPRIGFGASQ